VRVTIPAAAVIARFEGASDTGDRPRLLFSFVLAAMLLRRYAFKSPLKAGLIRYDTFGSPHNR
jgi:hypothetical protein